MRSIHKSAFFQEELSVDIIYVVQNIIHNRSEGDKMINEAIELYIDRGDFFLELIGKHLYISIISVLIASIVGLAKVEIISMKK